MQVIRSALRINQSVSRKRPWRTKAARSLAVLVLLFSIAVTTDAPASAQTSPSLGLNPTRFAPGSYQPGQVLVKFRDPASGRRASNTGLQPERLFNDALVKPYGVNRYKPLKGMPGYFTYYANPDADMARLVTALSLDSEVEIAEPNYIMKAARRPNDELYNQTYKDASNNDQFRQWYLKKIDAEAMWELNTGNNQVIAILDSGINPYHEDLNNKVIQERAYDFIRGKFVAVLGSPEDPVWDDDGHGTAVAGIIAARTNNAIGIAGLNWDDRPNLLSVKVLDNTGSGSVETVSQGIIYATDNQARIINLSLGSDQFSRILEASVQYAQTKGVLLVAASGNEPNAKPFYPAAYPNIIAVGATDRNDKLVGFSSYGPFVSVVAPGEDIFTTYCFFFPRGDTGKDTPPTSYLGQKCTNPNPAKYPVNCNNEDRLSCYRSPVNDAMYVYVNGTSFAAPIVTGLASLIVSARPDASNELIRTLLEGTATDIGEPGRDDRSGYGRVNARALKDALVRGDNSPERKSALQGVITGANPGDVLVNLDPPNQNKNINNRGSYRFDSLARGVYNLRVAVPKRGLVLGPVAIYPNGRAGNVINVNFDIPSGTIICGAGAICPGRQNPAPGGGGGVPIPIPSTLAPNSAFFAAAAPLPGAQFFPQTSHNLSGTFRAYWERNGGVGVFGLPISEEFGEVSTTDGRRYTVQYFERNRFEFHPENNEANKVLLGLLGSESTRSRSFPPGAPIPNTPTAQFFPETNHTLTDRFLTYWRTNGGLTIFGYPISEPIQEGPYLVQYFERNRFEFHPENAGTRFEILLGLLGVDLARSRNYIR